MLVMFAFLILNDVYISMDVLTNKYISVFSNVCISISFLVP